MALWNPWRGCHRCSDGCKYCFIHKGDFKRKVDTDKIIQKDSFTKPIEKYKRGDKAGEFKIKSGDTVYICFSSDFLIEEADEWRNECWKAIKERPDLNFLFLTKRIERFKDCIPDDWGDGFDNVTVGCSVENQAMADYRLLIFDTLPIKHKNIICQPLISKINLGKHLNGIELVVVGGEYDKDARVLDFDWILSIREECLQSNVKFQFRQCGSNFKKDGNLYKLNYSQLFSQAKKADINID